MDDWYGFGVHVSDVGAENVVADIVREEEPDELVETKGKSSVPLFGVPTGR